MGAHEINVAGAIAASLLAILALLALIWRTVVKPWLVSQLVDPLHETRHAVTINSHSSDKPTVLDRLSDLADGQQEIRDEVETHHRVIDLAVERLDGRLAAIERRQPDPEPDPTRERTYP